jgi:glycosyltransferase involved in cell wall biosynthesis
LDVIIPTRGVDIFDVERCLQSLVCDIKDFDKIILVDDNIEQLVELNELQNKFSNLEVHRGSQMGVAAARNLGLSFSRNELVAFVDSDDFVLPGYLEAQRLFHKRNISVAATGTWLQAFGAHTTVYPQWENFGVLNCLMCLPPAGVLMWKKSVLNDLHGFDEQFGSGFEDFHLVARASNAHFVIAILDSPLYQYQRGQVSLSQSWTQDQERHLRSKVNSLARNLCEHQFQEIFNLISSHGNLVLLSHPDFIFEINRNRFLIVLGRLLTPIKYRNNKLARGVWKLIPRILRNRLFKFATHLSRGL